MFLVVYLHISENIYHCEYIAMIAGTPAAQSADGRGSNGTGGNGQG